MIVHNIKIEYNQFQTYFDNLLLVTFLKYFNRTMEAYSENQASISSINVPFLAVIQPRSAT
jgi:hypothetical protein